MGRTLLEAAQNYALPLSSTPVLLLLLLLFLRLPSLAESKHYVRANDTSNLTSAPESGLKYKDVRPLATVDIPVLCMVLVCAAI